MPCQNYAVGQPINSKDDRESMQKTMQSFLLFYSLAKHRGREGKKKNPYGDES